MLVVLALLSQVAGASAAGLSISTEPLTAVTRTYSAPRTCTLTAIGDSYVNKAAAASNFGTATTLLVNDDTNDEFNADRVNDRCFRNSAFAH